MEEGCPFVFWGGVEEGVCKHPHHANHIVVCGVCGGCGEGGINHQQFGL